METKSKWPELLVIVRHGESQHNRALDVLQGIPSEEALEKLANVRDHDIELTELGKWQASETGKHLNGMNKFDICFSSPYRRTLQTAESIICNLSYDLELYGDIRLREKEFGRLHGLSKKQIKEKFPEEDRARKMEGKFYYRLLGGENYPDVGMRTHSFMDKLVRDYGGKKVLVVTHQVVYKMFRFWFEHLGEKEVLALEEAPNCGIETYILDTSKVTEGRMILNGFNEVAYDLSKAPKNLLA